MTETTHFSKMPCQSSIPEYNGKCCQGKLFCLQKRVIDEICYQSVKNQEANQM